MSGIALRWAHAQTAGNLTLKAVLLALASRAHDDGCTWASQGTLANDLECDVRTIRRSLQALEDKGFLVREDRIRDDGSRASDMIRLVLHSPDRKSGGGDRESGGGDRESGGGDRESGGGERESGGEGSRPEGTRSQSPGAPVRESPLTTFEQKPTQQESQNPLDSTCAWPVDFREQFQAAYPHWVKGRVAFAELDRLHREGDVPFEAILDGIALYVASKPPDRNWMGPDRFLADRRFEDRPAPAAPRLVRSDGAPSPRQPTGNVARSLELKRLLQEREHGNRETDDRPGHDQPGATRGDDHGVAWASGGGGRPAEPLLRAARAGGYDSRASTALRRLRAPRGAA